LQVKQRIKRAASVTENRYDEWKVVVVSLKCRVKVSAAQAQTRVGIIGVAEDGNKGLSTMNG